MHQLRPSKYFLYFIKVTVASGVDDLTPTTTMWRTTKDEGQAEIYGRGESSSTLLALVKKRSDNARCLAVRTVFHHLLGWAANSEAKYLGFWETEVSRKYEFASREKYGGH